MRDGFAGIDLNGGTDRCLHMAWPARTQIGERRIDQGILINPSDATAPFLVGDAAKMSPIARGWQWPLWAAKAGARHLVSELLDHLRNDDTRFEADEAAMLAAHIRHLVGAANEVGLVVPDDFGPGAQTRLLDVARRASSFDPRRGWTGWLPRPIWRSVATVFAWASRIDGERIIQLRGRRISVVSILDNRLTVAALEVDYELVGEIILITPVRKIAGKSSAGDFAPKFAESELVKRISDKQVREQIEAIAGARSLACVGTVPVVFQRDDGTWFENQLWPEVKIDLRDQLQDRGRADIRFLRDQISPGDIVLIECPDADRKLRDLSWSSWYAERIRGFERIAGDEVIELQPEGAVLGACEYVARITHRLPTYFDHIHGIEIAAGDGEGHSFIPLYPEETRVRGNEVFTRRLEGRFAVQPGSQTLSFHLWRQDDPTHVRRSKTELEVSPNDQVPITLEITQRPVSGYAVIEIVPEIDGALGGRRIVLDWEKMSLDEITRAQVIEELDRNLPKSFPNHAPTSAHSIAWKVIPVLTGIRTYLLTHVTSQSLSRATAELLTLIRQRISNPRYHGTNIDHPVYLFDSNGSLPDGVPQGHGDPNDLVKRLRAKITEDIEALGGRDVWRSTSAMPREMSDLLLAGCWMYANAPEVCLTYMRDVFAGRAKIGQRIESIGRVVSTEADVELALSWLMERLRTKILGQTTKRKIARELKTISMIIQYRENAYRFFDSKDSIDLVNCALMNLSDQLNAKEAGGRPKDLNFSFLFSATVFLLALRYRKKDAKFLAPPAKGEKVNSSFSQALQILQHASDVVRDDMQKRRRRIHRLAPEVLSNAIEFLKKTGGNPDIIVVIAQAEAEDDVNVEDD